MYKPAKIPPKLFNIKQLDNLKIIKYGNFHNKQDFINIRNLVHYNIRNPNDYFVNCFEFNVIEKESFKYSYSYVMEHLSDLTGDEKKLIENIVDNVNIDKSVIENHNKLYKFVKTIMKYDIYDDLHSGNIRRDYEGNFKIIDLEGTFGNKSFESWKISWDNLIQKVDM